jgi:hypothetical protein
MDYTKKAREYLENNECSDIEFKLNWQEKGRPPSHPFIYSFMSDFTNQIMYDEVLSKIACALIDPNLSDANDFKDYVEQLIVKF